MKMQQYVAAALALALISASANAVVVDDGDAEISGSGVIDEIAIGGTEATIEFEWTEAPFSAFYNFSTDWAFDLALTAYSPSASTSDVSGVIVDLLDAPGGDLVTRLTTDTTFCQNAALSGVSGPSGHCDLITGAANSGGNANGAAKPGTVLFSSLNAGSYRLGIYESASPGSGTAQFTITEQVPAPATLALLALGMAGLRYRRARRSAGA